MGLIAFDQLYNLLDSLETMSKNAAEAVTTFGSEIANYIKNDIQLTCDAYYYAIPNNKLKSFGCPMRRELALRRARKNVRRNH